MNKKSKKKIYFFAQHAWQNKNIMIIYVQQDEQKRGEKMTNRLKSIREEQGLSQEELSRKSTVSRTIISELENFKTDVVTNVTLEKIAKALNKKVVDIFFIE